MNQRRQIPMIIGITHLDCPGAWGEENIAIALGYVNEETRPPIVKVNATSQASVTEALIVLVQYCLENASMPVTIPT